MAKQKSSLIGENKIRIIGARLSFPHLFEPQQNDDGTTGKYNCCLIIDKEDEAFKEAWDKALTAAKLRGKNEQWGGVVPSSVTDPINEGDDKGEDYPEFSGCWYINPKSTKKVDTCVITKDGKLAISSDEEEFYAGCYVIAVVTLYPYNVSKKKGIAVGLEGVVKIKEGERLGGKGSVQNDLADMDFMAYVDDNDDDEI